MKRCVGRIWVRVPVGLPKTTLERAKSNEEGWFNSSFGLISDVAHVGERLNWTRWRSSGSQPRWAAKPVVQIGEHHFKFMGSYAWCGPDGGGRFESDRFTTFDSWGCPLDRGESRNEEAEVAGSNPAVG